jgi:hypothetical protein
MADKFDLDKIETAALYAASNTGLFPKAKSSLFRYVSMRGDPAWALLETTLLQNTLPLAQSTKLNDPFEANPVIVNDTSSSDIANFAKQCLVHDGTPMNFDKLHVVRLDGSKVDPDELASNTREYFHSLMDFRNKHCHIGSFSRRISSELQWSHYADGYKGLVCNAAQCRQ